MSDQPENRILPGSPSSEPEHAAEMPLVAHLKELRNRLMKCLLAVLLVFGGLYPFSNTIYQWLSAPLRALLPPDTTMIATDVAAPFFAPFKLTLMAAVCVAIPVILYQIWAFIAPGLYKNEKRLALPLLVSSVILFYCGIAFAYFVVFPLIFGFFTAVGPEDVKVMTDISNYLDFVLKLFFAFGITFEIPVATVLLTMAGITSTAALKEKRPYIVVGCFIIGMLLTPPDVFSQTLLAVPMWMLFEVGLFFSRMVEKPKATDAEA